MNKQQQAEEIVEKYIKPLYSYALKKTANLQDAEDLAQDIIFRLYKALLNKEIYNLDAFVWRLAHNVLVNYYRGKARSSIGVSLDELTPSLCSDEELSDGMIKKESIKKLQHEIAYLSKTQREILIMYYYEGRRLEEISGRLKLPLGTVKWHLFCARNEIKKGMDEMRNANELKFNPIKFAGAGISGSLGTMGGTLNFFRSTLTQNIAYSVYREAKSINEIADCIGVSPAVIWLKDETIKEELVELCNRVRAKCQKELMPLKEEYEKLAIENVPKHLKKMVAYGLQYTFYSDGPFLLYSLKELISSGRLKLPKEEQRVSLSILILQ